MDAFFGLLGMAGIAVGGIGLIVSLLLRKKAMPWVLTIAVSFASFILGLGLSDSGPSEELLEMTASRDAALVEVEAIKSENERLKQQVEELDAEFEAFKAESADFLKLSEDEKAAALARAEVERLAAEEEARLAKEEADRIAAEREAEEKAKKEAEEASRLAEEAKGYETGIAYKDIARSPDAYKGKKVKFSGEVIQVSEGILYNHIRLATKNGYDDVVYCSYDPNLLNFRILEEDQITVYGVCEGVESYTSVLGAQVTLPSVSVERIDLNQ